MFKTMNYYGRQNIPFLFILDFRLQEPIIIPLEAAASAGIFFEIKDKSNFSPHTHLPHMIEFQKYPIPYTRYCKGFQIVQQHLKRGNSFLTNLTYPTRIEMNLSLRQILEYSTAKFKLLYKDQFVSFSPEPFIKIQNGCISSYPMKGTIDAQIPHARATLLADTKERAEHNTIVDLIRNDLSQVATRVRVKRFRYLDEVQTLNGRLLQMSSEIEGQLPKNYQENIGDILAQLLPAGSISGAPKQKTVEIIQAAEGYERGYYTGIFGYYDNGYLESGVLIRFIERIGNDLYYKSGGGITVFSKAEQEYQELISKVYVPIHRKHFNTERTTAIAQLA